MKSFRTHIYSALLTLSIGAPAFGQQVYNYSTFAGTVGTIGSHNAMGTSATFDEPVGVAVDSHGNVYIADKENSMIRLISSAGLVSTLAGSGAKGHLDANGTTATFNEPEGVAVDASGNVFVADTFNSTIRKIDTSGNVSTYAGTALSTGNTNSTTVATAALFMSPSAVAVDSSGNVYVADTGNNSIRKIAPGTATVGGPVTTFATGFNGPEGIAVDTSGNVYVADTFNSVIDKITSGGTVSLLAGSFGVPGTNDGTGSSAQFSLPVGVAVDGAGNVYVGDTVSDLIRKVTQAGVVTTIGGTPGDQSFSNGTDSYALLDSPEGIAVSSGGALYFADTENEVIREAVTLTISGDLLGNGMPDILWTNTTTGQRGAYMMSGTTINAWFNFGTVPTEWRLAAVADFTGNGNNDILWQNMSTGECGFWMMSGTIVTGWVDLGISPIQWQIAAVGNFSGTGSNDILWQNTSTGECGFWIMSGTTVTGWVDLGIIPTQWRIAGAGDFNGDGKPDIVWQNTSTGECGFYIMNGTTVTAWAGLGTVTTDWRIAAIADFNGDGMPDILWQNTSTGECGFWIMNGTSVTAWVGLGTEALEWQIQPE